MVFVSFLPSSTKQKTVPELDTIGLNFLDPLMMSCHYTNGNNIYFFMFIFTLMLHGDDSNLLHSKSVKENVPATQR